MGEKLIYKLQYRSIRRYCGDVLGLEVIEKSNQVSQALLLERRIIINGNLKREHKLYVLLHEAGHFIIYDSSKYKKRYGYVHKLYGHNPGKFGERCCSLEEEYAAWWKGYRLSEEAGIKISRERYERYKQKQLRGYIRWSIDKDRKRWRDG